MCRRISVIKWMLNMKLALCMPHRVVSTFRCPIFETDACATDDVPFNTEFHICIVKEGRSGSPSSQKCRVFLKQVSVTCCQFVISYKIESETEEKRSTNTTERTTKHQPVSHSIIAVDLLNPKKAWKWVPYSPMQLLKRKEISLLSRLTRNCTMEGHKGKSQNQYNLEGFQRNYHTPEESNEKRNSDCFEEHALFRSCSIATASSTDDSSCSESSSVVSQPCTANLPRHVPRGRRLSLTFNDNVQLIIIPRLLFDDEYDSDDECEEEEHAPPGPYNLVKREDLFYLKHEINLWRCEEQMRKAGMDPHKFDWRTMR